MLLSGIILDYYNYVDSILHPVSTITHAFVYKIYMKHRKSNKYMDYRYALMHYVQ